LWQFERALIDLMNDGISRATGWIGLGGFKGDTLAYRRVAPVGLRSVKSAGRGCHPAATAEPRDCEPAASAWEWTPQSTSYEFVCGTRPK
jgi:hypothetical protein